MPLDIDEQTKRRETIRTLLAAQLIKSQGELARQLARKGFHVTQSSVSRDLQELNVVKIEGRYVLADTLLDTTPKAEEHPDELETALMWIQKCTPAGNNLLVVQTPPGRAPALAAVIDKSHWPEIVGSIAGDDTIFFATRTRGDSIKLARRLGKEIR